NVLGSICAIPLACCPSTLTGLYATGDPPVSFPTRIAISGPHHDGSRLIASDCEIHEPTLPPIPPPNPPANVALARAAAPTAERAGSGATRAETALPKPLAIAATLGADRCTVSAPVPPASPPRIFAVGPAGSTVVPAGSHASSGPSSPTSHVPAAAPVMPFAP